MNIVKVSTIIMFMRLFLFSMVLFSTARVFSQWSIPIPVTENLDGFSEEPQMTITDDGKILFCWTQNFDSRWIQNGIYFRELSNNIWSPIKKISDGLFPCSLSSIFADHNGVYHIVWNERHASPMPISIQFPTDILYSKKSNDNWSPPENIYHNKDTIFLYFPSQTGIIDSKNVLNLVWCSLDSLGVFSKYRRLEGYKWTDQITLKIGSSYQSILIDKNNRIHLVFISGYAQIPGVEDMNSVLYAYSDDNGKSWSDIRVIQQSGLLGAYEVNIFQDKNNNIHAIWGKTPDGNMFNIKDIYHSILEGSKWSEPEKIITLTEGSLGKLNIVCDKSNNFHLCFYQLISTSDTVIHSIYYSKYNSNEWTKPEKLLESARNPVLSIDSAGYLHLAFLNLSNLLGGSMKVYYMKSINSMNSIQKNKQSISKFRLLQNYPNPFNPSTRIEYEISETEHVSLKIYSNIGQIVDVLVNKTQQTGRYIIEWLPKDLPSGLYFYNLQFGGQSEYKNMLYLK